MKNSKHALIALLAVLSASVASASDQGFYGEAGYSLFSINGSGDTYKPKLARVVVGKDIHENLSVEGMYANTLSKGSTNGTAISISNYGIYLKPKMEVAKDTEVFARVGWSRSAVKATTSNTSESSSDSDGSYGLGVQTKFTKDVYGQVDYMSYYSKDGVSIKGFTVSVGTRF